MQFLGTNSQAFDPVMIQECFRIENYLHDEVISRCHNFRVIATDCVMSSV